MEQRRIAQGRLEHSRGDAAKKNANRF